MKCPNCNVKIVKYPLKDKDGKFILKNLFKMDAMSFVFLICIIGLFLMVKVDIQNYKEILENPIEFCEKSNACKVIEESAITSIGGEEIQTDDEGDYIMLPIS